MQKTIAFFLLLIALNACESKLRPLDYFVVFQNMRWLVGSWEGEYEGKPFFETWELASDTLLRNTTSEGQSFIRVIGRQVFYTNDPKPGEQMLRWKLADCNEQRVRFENPTAPYSQTIVFEHTPDDRWKAVLVTKGDTVAYLLKRKN